ncbi:zinc metallopeptidase [Natranaerobius thermophilus]|uniref:Peptidase membrane zinc metallopeptidase putative n=1 Tax=Natranaerobius thermophilus (strain ATCC BAA-1301 / DSM 18059 / JW/NM-WN-LF) TaxID=457570 RepID=B2A2K4_NATTJ|nr:zinc metallopeptidase [Natranaerobius thermophilus]ACB84919.1 peptidase membrane zinc metallopeptidase putative [Natranaerobius thermophilus JW/NM-WN-LF]
MFFFDTGLILFVIPAFIFVMYAQNKVKGTYQKYVRVPSKRGFTGAQVARALLDKSGLSDVRVEKSKGELSDHYDPRKKAVRLSPNVHDGTSIASLGIAAHETGHAIQHADGYFALSLRNMVFPAASFGSKLGVPLFFIGFIFAEGMGTTFMDLGIALFFFAVLFQIITLPVEFNASTRAVAALEGGGYLTSDEVKPTKQVLNAAAMTYVAATAMALAQLLRLIMLRGRR